jgi:hypothetical protein
VLVAVNAAWPEALVGFVTVAIAEAAPPSSRVTVFPGSGLPPASRTVTVIEVVSRPLFWTEPGVASTVDSVASTGPSTIV